MYKVYNVYIRYMMLLVHSGKIFVLVQQGQELGYRNSKITFKEENMTAEQKKKCHAIIHAASVAAGGAGAGMAQIPGSDNAVITPIQLTMTISLGKVFGVTLTESAAKAAIGSLAASTVGRTVTQVLVGWIPGVGNAINATTAAGLTESLSIMLWNRG